MDIMQVVSVSEINTDEKAEFSSVAFDTNYFYFISPNVNKIYKYSFDLEFLDFYETNRNYKSICYDIKNNCFWACINIDYFWIHNETDYIIKLDTNFKEVDTLKIKKHEKSSGKIKGINYNFEDDKLIILYNSSIIEINKNKDKKIITEQKNMTIYYQSAITVKNHYIYLYTQDNFQHISIFNTNNELIFEYCLPTEYYIKDIQIDMNKYNKDFYIYFLALKYDGEYCLIKCKFLDKSNTQKNHSTCSDNVLKEPRKNIDIFNNIFDHTDFKKFEKNEHYDSNDSYNTIIESIALLQVSLAKILNIEADKIQKSLDNANSIDEILKVNELVRKNISKLIHLEQLIFSILDAFNEMTLNACNQFEIFKK